MKHLIVFATAIVARFPIPGVRQPPESYLTTYRVLHPAPLHRHTGITQCLALSTDCVALLVGFLIGRELYTESRTLIFLHTDACTALIGGTDGETAIEQALRQGKLYVTLTKTVCHSPLFSHHFVVGITQLELNLAIGNSLIFEHRHLLPHDGTHADGLTRTIDAAIRKQVGMYLIVRTLIVRITSVAVRRRTIAVCLGERENAGRLLVILHLIHHLTLSVSRIVLVGLWATPTVIEAQTKRCPFDGLARSGIHHHIAYRVVGLMLNDDTHAGHEVKRTRHGGFRLSIEFQHIHTGGQSVKQYGIFKVLIVLMSCERHRTPMLRQFRQFTLQLRIIF